MIKLKTFMVLVAILALGLMMPAVGAATILNPIADSWVGDGKKDVNHHSDPTLYVRAGKTVTVHSYLKFDLSPIPSGSMFSKADLYLYVTNTIVSRTAGNLQAAHVANDNWTENGITWNTAPAASGVMDDTESIVVGTGYWVKLNLLAEGSAWVAGDLTDDCLSVMLKIPTEPGSGYPAFSSKEASTNHPYLDIVISTVPVPGSAILFGSGLLSMGFAFRRKRKSC